LGEQVDERLEVTVSVIVKHGDYDIDYVEYANTWQAKLGIDNVGQPRESLVAARAACDAHRVRENKGKRVPCILKQWKHGGDIFLDATITSIDGEKVWVMCEGKRSKESPHLAFADTKENRDKIAAYVAGTAQRRDEQKAAEQALAALPKAITFTELKQEVK